METYVEKLSKVTFSLHHSPCCPSPFQVRLIRKGSAELDNKLGFPVFNPQTTHDIVGYGQTFEDAAKDAWTKKRKADAAWDRKHGLKRKA